MNLRTKFIHGSEIGISEVLVKRGRFSGQLNNAIAVVDRYSMLSLARCMGYKSNRRCEKDNKEKVPTLHINVCIC
jgi:hypothetical protein